MKRTLIAAFVFLQGCSYANLDDVKAHACEKWASVGYDCVGYDGWEWGLWFGGPYGGAKVWHYTTRKDAPGVQYTGYIIKWGDEYHVYGPTAIDAVRTPR